MPAEERVELFEKKGKREALVISLDQLKLVRFCAGDDEKDWMFDHVCISKSRIIVASKRMAVWSGLQSRPNPFGDELKPLTPDDRVLMNKDYVNKAIKELEDQNATECFMGASTPGWQGSHSLGPHVALVGTKPNKKEGGYPPASTGVWQHPQVRVHTNTGDFPDEKIAGFLGADWRVWEKVPIDGGSKLLQFSFDADLLMSVFEFVNENTEKKRLTFCLIAVADEEGGIMPCADGIPMSPHKCWFKFKLKSGNTCCGITKTRAICEGDPSLGDLAKPVSEEGDDKNGFIDPEPDDDNLRGPVPEPPF